MTLEPITTSGPTITVSTAEELMEAYELLSHQDGGGTIQLEGGDYGTFSYYPYGETYEEQPVIFKSADPDNPAVFERFALREVSNVRLENLRFEGSDDVYAGKQLYGHTTDNIQVVDCDFVYEADPTIVASGELPGGGVEFRSGGENILIEGCTFDGMGHALGISSTTNLEVIGNEFTNVYGDGLRLVAIQNGLIDGNYMHDFSGSPNSVNHDDLIQVWGSGANTLTSNLTISNNILLSSDSGSQSIFIRNEDFGKLGDSTNGYFQDITVTNNLIYNDHTNGIRVNDTEGLLIENNTLIQNPDLEDMYPVINANNSLDVIIAGNIAWDIWAPESATIENNVLVSYDNPDLESYVGNHFVNPFAGSNIAIQDLAVLETSPWYGEFGSTFGNSPDDVSDGATAVISATASDADQYLIYLDASGSFDASGMTAANPNYTYHWTFPDGTTAQGLTVSKLYEDGGFKGVELQVRLNGGIVADISRNISVETKDVFAFDFESGVEDVSEGAPLLDTTGETTSFDGSGAFQIGDGNKIEVRDLDGRWDGFDSFGLSMDLAPTGDETSGVFLNFYQVMEGGLYEDGRVWFNLTTDEGSYELVSREPIFEDGETHRLGIAFDGTSGQLEMFADGESVSSTAAFGSTAATGHSLVFGNTWKDSMDAVIDNVVMSIDPSVAGDLPVVEPPVATEPPVSSEPPAGDEEEPPVRDEEEPPQQPDEGPDNDRGAPPEPVEASRESTNFLSDLLDIFLSIFGLGGDDEPAASTDAAAYVDAPTLADLVPTTDASIEDETDVEDLDEVSVDLAA